MVPRVKAEFLLTGEGIRFEEVTQVLGLKPSRTWRSGDPIQGTQLRRKGDAWVLASRVSGDVELVASINDVLQQLAPIAERVKSVTKRYGLEAELSCSVYVDGASPEIRLEPRELDLLASLGAALDIDVVVTEA